MSSKNERTSTLYVVGTPIGNLGDLSPRAAQVLKEADLVAAEDTRVTRRLLNHLEASSRLISFNEHNWRERLDRVMQALERGGDVALVSDAGMPGISDPGRQLVSEAADRGIRIESVPGPSAVTTALSVSGLSADAFLFLGFLSRRRRERLEALREAARSSFTVALFEAPHRLRATLVDIADVFGDQTLSVCRELTKLHEEVFRGTATEALEHFASPRGEFVVVIGGIDRGTDTPVEQQIDESVILNFLLEQRAAGIRGRDAVSEAAERYGVAKNDAYRLWLQTASRDLTER